MPSELNLSNLKPAEKRRDRKRVGRGLGSGKGRYSGRGIKGQKSRAGFEGGQMPAYMRMGKQRGSTSKDAMPIGPFRTATQGVNVRDLERVFDAGTEITPELLKAKRLIRSVRVDVKILGQGDLEKTLTVSAHGFSKSAREKIEAAGGQVVWLRGEPKPKPKKVRKQPAPAAAEPEASEQEAPEQEASAEAPSEPGAETADE